MNKKLCILGVTAVLAASIIGVNVFANSDASFEKLKQLNALFNESQKKFEELPNQTPEEIERTVAEGQKLKKMDLERAEVKKELDPDNVEDFENQLNSSIMALGDCVQELKERAVREANPEYEKKAEAAQTKLEKVKKGKQAFLNKEKSVAQLRKELDIPAY